MNAARRLPNVRRKVAELAREPDHPREYAVQMATESETRGTAAFAGNGERAEPVGETETLEGLRTRGHRRRSVRTTDSRHQLPIVPNRLNERFTVDAIGRVGVSDSTYVPTIKSWMPATTVLGLCSKCIVGRPMSHRSQRRMLVTAFLFQGGGG